MMHCLRGLRGLTEGLPSTVAAPLRHLAPGFFRSLVADSPEAEAWEQHTANSWPLSPQDMHVKERGRGEEASTSPRCRGAASAVRVQGAALGRRRVLRLAGSDTFVSNVATLLLTLQQQHAPGDSQAGRATVARGCSLAWREAVGDPRFLQLFPRRISPDTKDILQRLQGGARSSEPGGAGGKARDIAWTREDAARHSAMLRLIDQLQEVQRQLQEAMPQDEDSDGDEDGTDSSYVTVAAFTLEDGSFMSQPRDRTRSASGSARGMDGDMDAADGGLGEQAPSSWPCPLGRRRRAPGGRLLRAPVPPWDDTQPFQTHVGTVYHFWRLAPYG